jgi:hypothetical protein
MRVDKKIKYKPGRIDVIRYLLPWPFHREFPPCPNGNRRELDFGDLVLSVLPWPFHKDLPQPGTGEVGCKEGD